MKFDRWFRELDRIGVKESLFDPPGMLFLCPGSKPRRPYQGRDGFFYQCFEDGMTPSQALSEAMVEQDA